MVVSDSWWKFVFGVAPDFLMFNQSCGEVKRLLDRGLVQCSPAIGYAPWRSAPRPSMPATAWPPALLNVLQSAVCAEFSNFPPTSRRRENADIRGHDDESEVENRRVRMEETGDGGALIASIPSDGWNIG